MPPSTPARTSQSYVRKRACVVDRAGGQCIGDEEVLTQHAKVAGEYITARRTSPAEDELSLMRGELTVEQACRQRAGTRAVVQDDIDMAGVRYARAGDLRAAGLAVIHTCGLKGEGYGHVSVAWPASEPLDVQDPDWPPKVQRDFNACCT